MGKTSSREQSRPRAGSPGANSSLREHARQLLGQKIEPVEAPPRPANREVVAYAPDPSQQYRVRYEVVELADLQTSNDESGKINPNYPQELQPRDRTTIASKQQVERIAQGLVPDAYVEEFRSLDRGAPIVGPDDNAVESGNGRTIALKVAADQFPEQYDRYKERLREVAAERGINPDELDNYNQPVLVRRRVDEEVDRVEFAQIANDRQGLEMNIAERSRSDAERISGEDLISLEISGDTDKDLQAARNRDFVRSFVAKLPANERGATVDRKGNLTQDGLNRVKAGLFTRVYGDHRLAERIFLSNDNNVKNVTNGVMSSLGQVGQAEEMVKRGERDSSLSIRDDVSAAVNKFAHLKGEGTKISDYVAQQAMFDRELSPTQEKILVEIDKRSRSGKQVKEFMESWADKVNSQPNPNQMGFMDGQSKSREQLIDEWLAGDSSEQTQRGLF